MSDQKLKINPKIVVRKIGTETVLVPVGQSVDEVRNIFTLNSSAAEILSLIQKELSVNEIQKNIIDQFEHNSIEESKKWIAENISYLKENSIVL